MTDLREAFEDLARQAPHDPDLAGSVRRRARRQARRAAAVAASVAGVLAVTGTSVALTGGSGAAPAAPAASGPLLTCPTPPADGVLPRWARTGFSDPNPRVPHVLGERGQVVAILFGQPLTAPTPDPDGGNKVLWVVQAAEAEDFRILATLPGTDQQVFRAYPGGAGPSEVDLPAPGCWRFDLRWGPYTDSLFLQFDPA